MVEAMIKNEGMEWEAGRSFWTNYNWTGSYFFLLYVFFDPRLLQIPRKEFSWDALRVRPHQRQLKTY